ncbi:MAG TPA: Nramp family divalent metal transporter [Terriglobales bacterium]|nr:Nramp family divalent metal transporter [Terriglobales bacterium]
MFRLPTTATAPFCPSEVRGTVAVGFGLPFWKKVLRFAGPGLLISVGYMDPGNWATDIEAGSRFGNDLLFVVGLSSLAGIILQTLCARLGIVAERDLAQLCRTQYSRPVALMLWLLAEIAIIACDVAEVLGSALALQLLFHLPLWAGVLLTGFDTIIVLSLKGHGFRQLEAIVLGLVGTIAFCFLVELILLQPALADVAPGFLPKLSVVTNPDALYLAIGIIGATVMPHNLYLHSSVVQTRMVGEMRDQKAEAVKLATADITVSLLLAMFVNAAILITAATAFHGTGHQEVTDIDQAYRLLEPLAGSAAAILFGLALLASGQSSTFTGTLAGQVIMDGFLQIKIPCYQRRLITRALALIPAFIGVVWFGEGSVGRLLVLTQVVLTLQLPFALYPLIRFTGSRKMMGPFASGPILNLAAWLIFLVIVVANIVLLWQLAV